MKFKKLFRSLVCGFIAMSIMPAAACTATSGGTATDIEILYCRRGLGSQFLSDLEARFEEKYHEYNVIIDDSQSQADYITTTFGLGERYDPVDLYMFPQTALNNDVLTAYAEPLGGILETTVEGESKPISEKLSPSVLESILQQDGTCYALPYGGGVCGIVYDTDVIGTAAYPVPKTTEELFQLVLLLREDGYTPSIHFEGGGYWFTVAAVWQAQYDGLNYYRNNYLALTDAEGNSPSKEIMLADDGRYEALKVLASILTPETVYNGSNDLRFTPAQTTYLNGGAVMMANGSWLMNEMSASSDKQHYAMMKTPVISSIVSHCDSVRGENGGTADAELSALIDAVDAADSAESIPLQGTGYNVSAEDAARVFEARNLMYSNLNEDAFIIPEYAVAKEGAKKFIEFCCSDEGIAIYTAATGLSSPYTLADAQEDTSAWTDWQKQQSEFVRESTPVFSFYPNTSKVFTVAKVTTYSIYDYVADFTAYYEYDRKSANEVWEDVKQQHNNNWDDYLVDANLI